MDDTIQIERPMKQRLRTTAIMVSVVTVWAFAHTLSAPSWNLSVFFTAFLAGMILCGGLWITNQLVSPKRFGTWGTRRVLISKPHKCDHCPSEEAYVFANTCSPTSASGVSEPTWWCDACLKYLYPPNILVNLRGEQ